MQHYFAIILLLFACTNFLGCSSAAKETTKNNLGVVSVRAIFPPSIISLSKNHPIRVEVEIDAGSAVKLDFTEVGTAIGTVKQIQSGEKNAKLTAVMEMLGGEMEILTSNKKIIAEKNTTVELIFNEYTFTDQDLDGFSNIGEFIAGTDWRNNQDFPKSDNVRTAKNYTLSDKIEYSFPVGSIATGQSESTNYQLISK